MYASLGLEKQFFNLLSLIFSLFIYDKDGPCRLKTISSTTSFALLVTFCRKGDTKALARLRLLPGENRSYTRQTPPIKSGSNMHRLISRLVSPRFTQCSKSDMEKIFFPKPPLRARL